jgi:lysophospholipase L1-like esterase
MTALLAAAAVVVVAGAVWVVASNHPPASKGYQVDAVHVGPPPTTDPVSSRPAKKPKRLVVAFLGDDWTAGTGASGPKHRFTTLVSHDLHLVERNFGADGTGYAKATSSDGDYASRVAAVVAAHPDIVVVAGGRNDKSDSSATVASRARSLFSTLRAQLPHATLVALAPMWGDSDEPAVVGEIGNVVNDAVTAAGGKYLDLPDPIHGHPNFMASAADPDDAGYAAIAAALEPKLTPLLPN